MQIESLSLVWIDEIHIFNKSIFCFFYRKNRQRSNHVVQYRISEDREENTDSRDGLQDALIYFES